MNNITIAQFFAWNPAVGNQCQGLWTGYRYCTRITDLPPDPDTTDSHRNLDEQQIE
ncbi:hypothetical protein MAPG_05635 [Magnaporthiopsis poae ATCC 64411]|uniref:LysM domain-containing protein n=1 Tax=Magnaporthiopsis poae (strain ATCC 64411 / 73-15) TaxID=644358 RepID=A0A0C4DZX4_MAGP6|nr:hypothetical protein MAPG_05635 [Magnaporthiopsis poae ATCC 64411]